MNVVNQRLTGIIKAGIVLYTFGVAGAGYILRGHAFGFGVMVGGAISLLEFWTTSWLVEKILTDSEAKLKAAVGLGFKSLFVLTLVAVLILVKAVEGIPFLLGLMGLFFGIIIGAALYFIMQPVEEKAKGQ